MNVTFCRTKAGNGFKIAVDNKWLYTSKDMVLRVINGESRSCQFREMDDSSDKDEHECKFHDIYEHSSESKDE